MPRATAAETLALVLQKEPSPLSRYSNEVPPELERIVTKALAKDREERYQTAKDLQIDLRNLKRRVEVDAEIDRTVPSELRPPLQLWARVRLLVVLLPLQPRRVQLQQGLVRNTFSTESNVINLLPRLLSLL